MEDLLPPRGRIFNRLQRAGMQPVETLRGLPFPENGLTRCVLSGDDPPAQEVQAFFREGVKKRALPQACNERGEWVVWFGHLRVDCSDKTGNGKVYCTGSRFKKY